MSFDISILVLRLAFGLIFVVHGWPKIKNLSMTASHFESMGFAPGNLWGTVVALVEFFGGLAVLLGIYAPIGALAIACDMLVATLWKLKRGQGLVGGYELDLILLASAITITLLGSGVYSLISFSLLVLSLF